MTDADPQTLIRKTRDLCKAATPGPLEADGDWIVSCNHNEVLGSTEDESDAILFAAAPTLLLELAQELEVCLQYKSQLVLAFDQHRRTQRELTDHKDKMVDLLADAYAKGRAFNEDVDDRTSENG